MKCRPILNLTLLALSFLCGSTIPARAYTLFTVPETWDAIWNGTAESAGGTIDLEKFWHDASGAAISPLGFHGVDENPPLYSYYYTRSTVKNMLIGNGKGTSNTGWQIGDGCNLYLIDDFASGNYTTKYTVGLEMLHNANWYPTTYINGGGSLNQATGTFQIDHGSLYIGDSSVGTYNLEGGSFVISATAGKGSRLTSYDLHIGSNLKNAATAGTGTFNIAGGSATIPTGGKVYVGTVNASGNPLSTGTINMTGGTIAAPEIQLVNGSLNYTAGTVKTDLMTVEKNGTLSINATARVDTNHIKTLTINNGKINFNTEDTTLYVGDSGTGVWNIQNSGTEASPLTINGTVRLGSGTSASGTLNITDSYVKHTGKYIILSNSGKAELNITNSTLAAMNQFYSGDSRNVTTSNTTININEGGKLETSNTASLSDKDNTKTTVNIKTGGNWTSTGTLKLGYSNHWGDTGTNHQDGGSVTFNLLGGSVNAKATLIGKTSTLNVGDGSFAVTGEMKIYGTSGINVGGTDGKTGTLTLSNTFNAYENAVVTLKSGGTFTSSTSAGNAVVFNNSSSLVLDGGKLEQTGTGTPDVRFHNTSSLKLQNANSELNASNRVMFGDSTESTMSAGKITTGSDLTVGHNLSAAGTAKLDVTGGTVNVGATLVLGVSVDSNGNLTIGGGTGTASVTAASLKIGERATTKSVLTLNPKGTLTVTQSGGFNVAQESGSVGELVLNGGAFSATGDINIGVSGTGIITKTDAGEYTIPNTIRLGGNTTAKGILNVYNGKLNSTGSYILTGISGNAEINVVGGALTAKSIYLGDAAAALTSNVVVKQNEEGRPGTLTVTNFWIADKNKTTGNVDVQKGGTVTATQTRVGYSQHFTDANGNHVGGIGTVLVSGGTYTTSNETRIGERGTLKVTDGSYTGKGLAEIVGRVKDSYAADPNAHGYVLLDGENAQMTFNGDVKISGTAVIELKDGTFTANTAGKAVTVGAYYTTGNNKQFLVDGESQLLIDGADVTIGTLNIGDSTSTHTGKVALSAGTLNVGTLNVLNGKGTFEMTGGTLNVGTSKAAITQNGGSLSPGGDDVASVTTLSNDYTLNGGSIHFNAGSVDEITTSWKKAENNDLLQGTGETTELKISGSVDMDLTDDLFSSVKLGDRIVLAQAPSISIGEEGLSMGGDLPDIPSYFWNYGLMTLGDSTFLFAELSVPEPATWILLLIGVGCVFYFRKK